MKRLTNCDRKTLAQILTIVVGTTISVKHIKAEAGKIIILVAEEK